MITNAERRFIEQWRDQKSGPKWKYYLLFSINFAITHNIKLNKQLTKAKVDITT